MIRRLDPNKDTELYRQCWEWRERYPRPLRDATAVNSVTTFEEFLGQSRGARADIGIFDVAYKFMDEQLIAVVSLQWKGEGIYEVHLSARWRGVRVDDLIEAGLSIVKTIFEGLNARFVFAFTPKWNRGAILFAAAMGFQVDGVQRMSGTSRGRVIVWRRLSMTKENYESDFSNKPDADGIGNLCANRIEYANYNSGGEYSRHRAA